MSDTTDVYKRQFQGSKVSVILHEDSETLSEVVVVGFGVQKKASVVGSVAVS